jgi:hypothetical protein
MSDGPPPRFRLSLLGSFALSGPNGLVDLSSKKLVGLLAYSCRPLSLQRQLFDFERISSRISRNLALLFHERGGCNGSPTPTQSRRSVCALP